MYRLYRVIPALVIVFFVVITAARLGGNNQPSPVVVLFTNADGTRCKLPCLFGIRPADTRFNEALVLLKAHPFLGAPQTYLETFDYNQSSALSFAASWPGKGSFAGEELAVNVYQDVAKGLVIGITFSVKSSCLEPRAEVSLGDMINLLGTPSMTFDRNGVLDRRFFFQDNSIMVVVVPLNGPDFQQSVYRPRPHDCFFHLTVQRPTDNPDYLRWCGFSTRNATCGFHTAD